MADQNKNPAVTNTFHKGMIKDVSDQFLGEGVWYHMLNGTSNNHDGQKLSVGNEPANFKCADIPYVLIGAIPLSKDRWVLFSTDDTNSEIGLFDATVCSYSKIVNSPCLNFSKKHLITGAARDTFDCSHKVYWADGYNPDRVIDINKPPFKINRVKQGDCYIETPTTELDCEQLRLAPLLTIPCLRLSKAVGSGTLLNGSYQVAVAYAVNSIRVTDYLMVSNVQSIFDHSGTAGAIELSVSNTDEDFDEMEVVVISMVNGQTVAKRLGFYSTRETKIYIDSIHPENQTIPLSLIPLQSTPIEKSDSIFSVGAYLLRNGIYSKADFNYQPQANKIVAKYVIVEYPENYYQQGGNNIGFMGDENYVFFIRWIYNTGEKSSSYVIPGRAPLSGDLGAPVFGDTLAGETYRWQTQNTATITALPNTSFDGGTIIAEGLMGYHETTEKYPDDRPDIWGDLCGKNIRLHKFPDASAPSVGSYASHYVTKNGRSFIRIKGVKFENITHPLDNSGNPITSIVGYEILRGSREGNKTVIAKGMLNNMRTYQVPGSNQTGLFQNYPYNDLRPDFYLTSDKKLIDKGTDGNNLGSPLTGYKKDMFSFHSPDVMSRPYLGVKELKIYQEVIGTSYGSFERPHKHPEFKLLSNFDGTISSVISTAYTLQLSGMASMGLLDMKLEGTEDIPMNTPLSSSFTVPNMYFETTAFGSGNGNNMIGLGMFIAMGVLNTVTFNMMAPIILETLREKLLRLITSLIPYRQFATQFNSHAFYDSFAVNTPGNVRRPIMDAVYVDGHLQNFSNYRVNNLYRNEYVLVETAGYFQEPGVISQITDTSRYTVSMSGDPANPFKVQGRPTVAYYGALKASLPSQYGQIDSVKQIPISTCIHYTEPVKNKTFSSPILFGGDTYVSRYTEKNPFLFFNDWLFDQPNDYAYDYRNYINVPYPRYWVDNRKIYKGFLSKVSNYRHLDYKIDHEIFFNIKTFVDIGYFYLFCNGVRDFFVESEVNVGYRDWEDEIEKRHYDPYRFTDLSYMFRSDKIKAGNYWKYDYSLSASRFFNQYISWGSVLPKDFDPDVAEKCYSYRPRRMMYSLPQSEELKKDNWRSFLVNNYKDFPSRVTSVRPIGKTGALFMMEQEAPYMFSGADTLQTDLGTKITVGDGGLFNQTLQSIASSDRSYQYASCGHKFAVTATPMGVFWVSQKQGKIFHYSSGLDDITRYGMKWHFSRYLPSRLLQAFPQFDFDDNPVEGVGVQLTYDNTNEVLYVTKKDYKPVEGKNIEYVPGEGFYVIKGYKTRTIPGTPVPTCPAGWTLTTDSQGNPICKKVSSAAELLIDWYNQQSVTHENYGKYGTVLYGGGYSTVNGTGTYTTLQNPFWNTPGLGNAANEITIWPNAAAYPAAAGSSPSTLGMVPNPSVFHHDVCITNSTGDTRTYYVALTGKCWITMWEYHPVGNTKTQIVSIASQPALTSLHNSNAGPLQQMTLGQVVPYKIHIYPFTLPPGPHIIRFRVAYEPNTIHLEPASFGFAIFDNTASEVINANSYGDLNVIATSKNLAYTKAVDYTCNGNGQMSFENCDTINCTAIRSATMTPGETITEEVPIREKIELCNPEYFEDVSWTASYSVADKTWLSFHSWVPELILPTQTHFITSYRPCKGDKSSLWKHNERWDKFCNYYGTNYPFELDYVAGTGQQVTTLRNVEYILEAYQYKSNGQDKFHVLDFNFDQAEVYNTEQHSGRLKLKLKSKTDPRDLITYPRIVNDFVEVLYSKEEQKYRFQIPYDLTKDRGEFSGGIVQMFRTKDDGVRYEINPLYIDYSKDPLQRKKIRHYVNHIRLVRMVSDDKKIIVRLINTKVQPSQR